MSDDTRDVQNDAVETGGGTVEHGVVERALDDLRERLASPRALAIRTEDRARLEKAADRVGARFLGTAEPVLTVALAGGTGVGKSTLINALAGSSIAESSEVRPTTTKIRVYHHRDVPEGGMPRSLGADALFVSHERDELRRKVLVDTPDLDSFVIGHRALTQKLLEAAGLVLYVFSPEKYLEERTWSVLREEHHFSSCVAVLNKADRVPRHELEKLTDDLRARFASIGIDDVRVFRVCAGAHVAARNASVEVTGDTIDELDDLRRLLEHELESGEIARLIRTQREQAIENLEACIDRVAPTDLDARIDAVEPIAESRAASAAQALAAKLGERLEAIEHELAPLATLAQHERFRGPFRTWLSVADFFRYGLTGIVQRILGGGARGDASVVRALLCRGQGRALDDVARAEARGLQAELFDRGLPVGAWSEITAETEGETIASSIADEIETRFDLRAVAHSARASVVVFMASFVGAIVPAGLLGYSLYRIGTDFVAGQTTGFGVLGQFVAVLVLFFALLQGIVSLLLPGTRGVGKGVGIQAICDVLRGTLGAWLTTYREHLTSDAEVLRAPLPILRDIAEGRRVDDPNGPSREYEAVSRVAESDRITRTLRPADSDEVEEQRTEVREEATDARSEEPAPAKKSADKRSSSLASRLQSAAARKRPKDDE